MQILNTVHNPGARDAPGVILIVLDACRPDGLQKAHTPNIDWIMENGAHTLKAHTIIPPITLPCHMSMLYGVKPLRHGIYGNYWVEVSRDCQHSILDLAHICGRKVASFYDWERLRDLGSPSVLDFAYYRRCRVDLEASMTIARECAGYIMSDNPDLCFMNLGSIDKVGHDKGWMSREYIDQITIVDQAVGLIIETLQKAGQMDQYYIIALADHGGNAKGHEMATAEELIIPWMVSGPGIKKGHEIKEDVYIYDTAPTIARLLRLPVQTFWHGKVINEIFDQHPMMEAADENEPYHC
jgi:predicted AlkP superfamily pyrophosphatase or phosphodiesterase